MSDARFKDLLVEAGFPQADLEIQVLCHFRQMRAGRASLVTDTYREIMGAAATSFEIWAGANMDLFAVAST